jgi:hypothetical protein
VKSTSKGGLAPLSLIIALLIMAFLAFFAIRYFTGQHGFDSGGSESPLQRAKNVQCLAQIKKIELQIQLFSAQNGRYPENLEMLDELDELDLYCPVSQSRYDYIQHTGRVYCPDHPR